MSAPLGAGTKRLIFTLRSHGKGCHLVTSEVQSAINSELRAMKSGLVNLFIHSLGVGLSINENADPTVRTDMKNGMDTLVPESIGNGKDVSAGGNRKASLAALLKAALMGSSLNLAVSDGRFVFGTWQGIYLCEFTSGTEHTLVATFCPTESSVTKFSARAPTRGPVLVHEKASIGISQMAKSKHSSVVGLALLGILHTSAAITVDSIKEVPSAGAQEMDRWYGELVPNRWNREFFEHIYEGEDDMTGHMKCSLMGPIVTLPVADGKFKSGPDQGVCMCELREREERRMFLTTVTQSSPPAIQTPLNVPLTASTAATDITQVVSQTITSSVSAKPCSNGLVLISSQQNEVGLAISARDTALPLLQGLVAITPEEWGTKFKIPATSIARFRAGVMGRSLTIPLNDQGQLMLDPNQGIALMNFGAIGKGQGATADLLITVFGNWK